MLSVVLAVMMLPWAISVRQTPNCVDWTSEGNHQAVQCRWPANLIMCCGPWGNTFLFCDHITRTLRSANCPDNENCYQSTDSACHITDYCTAPNHGGGCRGSACNKLVNLIMFVLRVDENGIE